MQLRAGLCLSGVANIHLVPQETFSWRSRKHLALQQTFGTLGNIWHSRKHLALKETFGALGNIWHPRKHLAPQETFGALGNIWNPRKHSFGALGNIWRSRKHLAPQEIISEARERRGIQKPLGGLGVCSPGNCLFLRL